MQQALVIFIIVFQQSGELLNEDGVVGFVSKLSMVRLQISEISNFGF